jgi:hypothetical protein
MALMSTLCCCVLLLVSVVSSLPCLPLLPSPLPGHPVLWGAQYSAPTDPLAKNRTDTLFGKMISAGGRLMQVSLPWADIEATPNQPNYGLIAGLLADVRAVGGIPLFNIAVIDTNRVSVPPDLADPNDPTALRFGLNWTSPELVDRFATLVQVVAPLAAYYGAPYFGVGNEIDVNLQSHPDLSYSFVEFVYILKQYIRTLTAPNSLAVGATLTVGGLANMAASPPQWVTQLFLVADVTPLTYYALQGDFVAVTDPAQVHDEILSAVSLLPAGACTVFQEFGVPSGYCNASSTDGSSQAIQTAFFNDFMLTMPTALEAAGHPLRAASFFELVDMPDEQCESFSKYYNVSSKNFVEYLCTLGIVKGDGTPKSAWAAVLSNVKSK